jgi:murein DD-endopeptidase MepM/ murein hydrolase activator NlpD
VQLSKIVQVNFLKPRLEVVTPEQNGVLGGSQLVFYRVMGKSPVSQGVNAKGTFYQGFPASLWDPAFKGIQDLYLTLFPLPLDFDASGDRMKITARDDIGNATQVPFGYRIRQRKSSAVRVDLSPERGAQVAQELSAFAREGSLKLTLTKDLFADLKTLLGALQLQDDGILMELLSRTDGRRWWKGPFGRPLPSYPASTFGDARTVTVGGVEVLQEKILGARFPVQNRSTVQAANNGRVAFVGSLGLLGETVVIDHGLGLASIYGHLSQASVKLQDEVTLGQPIGRTGQSGFAQSEEVLFQIRVHGVPVSPNEWWDPTWIKDHIENKVNFVKNTVGVAGP